MGVAGGAHLLKLHNVRVHEEPVVEDLSLHVLCDLTEGTKSSQSAS